jgi:[NiFe] hydrogenase assembly HybE family chaperone
MDSSRPQENRAQRAARHLAAVYERISGERMRDLPIRNRHLSVEAIGFQPWDGHVIGVLVTPWCMNLVLMPGPDDDWSDRARAPASKWELPAGAFQFNPCLFDDVELHFSTPLFSSVQDFPDQATARAIAEEILSNLLQPAGADAATHPGERGHRADALTARPVSRRGLLRRLALLEP